MASPGNRHCANCIGRLSFPMATDVTDQAELPYTHSDLPPFWSAYPQINATIVCLYNEPCSSI